MTIHRDRWWFLFVGVFLLSLATIRIFFGRVLEFEWWTPSNLVNILWDIVETLAGLACLWIWFNRRGEK